MLAALLLAAEEGADPARIVLPETDELLWGSLAFFILFFALQRFAFPALNKALAARQDKIRSGLEAAERAKAEAEATQSEYARRLSEARAEASSIIEEAKRTAEGIRRQAETRAQQDAADIVARARADVAGERDRAMQELRATLGDLSLTLASKVVERELADPTTQRAFVQRMIDELATAGNGHAR